MGLGERWGEVPAILITVSYTSPVHACAEKDVETETLSSLNYARSQSTLVDLPWL